MTKPRILIACEFSGVVREAFEKKGWDAWSCDTLDTEIKGQHIKDDVLNHLSDGWDLMIAHPPCTYLCVSGARWYYNPADKNLPIAQRRPHPRYPNRRQDQKEGITFFLALANADIKKIAVENPIGIMSRVFRKPDQIIQPYQFGEEASKATCLWLKNLPKLTPTKIVGKGKFYYPKSGGARMSKLFTDCTFLPKEERQKIRGKTFKGIAQAMAEQWGTIA